jgi:hypothetical protein
MHKVRSAPSRPNQGRDSGIGQTLVARDQQRIVWRDHQHRLFEPGIEPGQPVQVRRMLAVAVDDQRRMARPRHCGPDG